MAKAVTTLFTDVLGLTSVPAFYPATGAKLTFRRLPQIAHGVFIRIQQQEITEQTVKHL